MCRRPRRGFRRSCCWRRGGRSCRRGRSRRRSSGRSAPGSNRNAAEKELKTPMIAATPWRATVRHKLLHLLTLVHPGAVAIYWHFPGLPRPDCYKTAYSHNSRAHPRRPLRGLRPAVCEALAHQAHADRVVDGVILNKYLSFTVSILAINCRSV